MEKSKRTTALGTFTRNVRTLNTMLDDACPKEIVTTQYEKLQACWDKLEAAHDNYLETIVGDIDDVELNKLDEPSDRYHAVLKRYSDFIKTANDEERTQLQQREAANRDAEKVLRQQVAMEKKEAEDDQQKQEMAARFESAKTELETGIDVFNRFVKNMELSLAEATESVKRSELGKVEAEFNALKVQLVKLGGIDVSQDATVVSDKFADDAEKVFMEFHKNITSELTDSHSATSGGTIAATSSKKELVDLPTFQGDEKTSPFIKFPTWFKQWEIQILDYEPKYRWRMLEKHLDETARAKFIGYEGDYEESLKRLKLFYGDRQKVVKHVLQEVMAPIPISAGDYRHLIMYSVTLENNYSRLTSLNMEHEMSNTSIMAAIVKKFPRAVCEKWHAHLLAKTEQERAKPFPLFIQWLITEKAIWECMVSSDVESSGSSFFVGGASGGGDSKTCFKCGEAGHISRHCPTNTNNTNKKKEKAPRRDPSVKKYWCALHKDDSTRRCYSNACQDLRKMTDIPARIRLLTENGDCIHCCGDHKPADCRHKDRVCGGGKVGQGCKKGHKTHELFCADAKICMFVSMTVSQENESCRVVLCIMQVPAPGRITASVFFDSGSTSNFIREAFAKLCGFRGRLQTLSVTTLGGVVTEFLTVTEYNCELEDVNGKMVPFKAYGMECITSDVSEVCYDKLRRFFPQVSDKLIHQLQRKSRVDVLIGLPHPSMHPERSVRAKGGGDFWIYKGQFGSCVGGRHPQLMEETRKSQDLFVVNHYTKSTPSNIPHELEYCPHRAVNPYHLSVASTKQNTIKSTTTPWVETVNINSSSSSGGVVVDPPVTVMITEVSIETVQSESVSGDETKVTSNDPSSIPTMNVDVTSVVDCTAVDMNCVAGESAANDSSDVDSTAVVDSCVMNSRTDTQNLNVGAPSFSPGEQWDRTQTNRPSEIVCNAAQTSLIDGDAFFQAEALGTVIDPKCGGCRCNKCPVPGSKYSFLEQRQFDKINRNMFHDKKKKRWITKYPWKCERSVLPRNMKAALKQLHAMEKSLLKRRELADEFCEQIQNMVTRGAAVVLSEKELRDWNGDHHYLPLVGVKGKKSLRVCFDFARRQCGAPSFNDCLDKGPDRFVNNLLAVILGFRNGRVGCVADIIKFHNQVHLVPEDIHMQRFLWRNMKTDEPPTTYAVPVNNFGASPANCIATCALRNTADMFADIYPVESKEIKEQTYIDDELTAAPSKAEALIKTQRWDEIKAEASMPNRGWMYSGDDASVVEIGGDLDVDKVLGLAWDPKSDTLLFRVKLKLKMKSGGLEIIEISTVEKLLEYRESILTRRILQSNILSIFDPAGLLTPILLQSKLLLRESWCGLKPLGWDDILPQEQGDSWITFLSALLSLGELRFPRSLWPDQEVIGSPVLIVFSDGALLSYGTAAYIRWELKSGGYWTRLIMAKSKIAPKNILSIPRMELNGAVMNNRVKNFLLKDTNLNFSTVYQFVDSSTVLGYLHKESGVYKPFEGVRVSEVQSTNVFEDVLNTTTNKTTTRLKNWAWVAGKDNPADMCTKPRPVQALKPGGDWQVGPEFLQLEVSEWPIKLTYCTDKLDGEIVIGKSCHVSVVNVAHPDLLGRIVNRCGSWKRMKRVLAWILRLGIPSGPLLAVELRRAKYLLLKFAQKDIQSELRLASESGKGRFRRLAPVLEKDGLFRVGSRIRQHVPFTFDSKLPVILPTKHLITLQIMRASHNHSHVASDGTLCRFRMEGYWTVKAGVIAKKVANACVDCRKKAGKTLSQPLGEIPAEQLKYPMAWGHCQMDIFGPYHCRSDVNARSTKKIWGIVIEDVNSGAVHIDVITDYSTNAVLMTLRRFGSLRGWPGQMRSDPGSQLESASGKLENWWSSFGESLQTLSSSKNFEWILSPPDSPWRQGKAERRIGVIKDLLRVSVGDTRVTPLELQTIFMEISNICNERPIGVSKPRADGTYTVITPNHLLLGRSSNILPDDSQLSDDLHYTSRYRLVNHVTTVFWQKWCAEVACRLVFRQKWHTKSRNLRVNDVVMIHESSPIKAKYKLAVVETVHTSDDGLVRSATVRYAVVNGERSTNIRVKRSIQRLVLILPVEEQDNLLEVTDLDTRVQVECRSPVKAGV